MRSPSAGASARESHRGGIGLPGLLFGLFGRTTCGGAQLWTGGERLVLPWSPFRPDPLEGLAMIPPRERRCSWGVGNSSCVAASRQLCPIKALSVCYAASYPAKAPVAPGEKKDPNRGR
jgi:hypothetical protein